MQPLSEHTANIITDLFPSIRALEEGTRTYAGREKLYTYFDKGIAGNIIDFWEDEWLL